MTELPIVNDEYFLQRTSGKGGWTYVIIPGFLPDNPIDFKPLKVKGNMDTFELKNARLMSTGSGSLFLPVRTEIRKKIRKEAGDMVYITLFEDTDSLYIPEEFMLCLNEDRVARDFYFSLSEGQQQGFLNWIYSAKKEETKIDRIAKTLNKLVKGEKYP